MPPPRPKRRRSHNTHTTRRDEAAEGTGERARLLITGLAHGGVGVGRDADRLWFVPFTAPGEIVVAEAVDARAGFVRGRLVEVVTPSALRRPPVCAHFGHCGGCQLQHMTDEAQRAAKAELVASAFAKVTPARPSAVVHAEPLAYRARAELHVVPDGDGMRLGYRGARSHEVLTPLACPVLDPTLEACVLALARLVSTVPGAVPGRYELHVGREGVALCAHIDGTTGREAARWLGRVLEDIPSLAACAVVDHGRLRYTLRDGRVHRGDVGYSPGVFGQSHRTLADGLAQEVVQQARPMGQSVLELYAGAGHLTLPLARQARRLVTAEENPLACADARASLEAASLRAEVLQGSAARVAQDLVLQGARFDVVVLDPPRKGAADVLPAVCDLEPARIVYVGCEPMTAAQDLFALRPRGYVVTRLSAFDLFPQTFHVEVVAVAERQGLDHRGGRK